jgi:hypothetical protein
MHVELCCPLQAKARPEPVSNSAEESERTVQHTPLTVVVLLSNVYPTVTINRTSSTGVSGYESEQVRKGQDDFL